MPGSAVGRAPRKRESPPRPRPSSLSSSVSSPSGPETTWASSLSSPSLPFPSVRTDPRRQALRILASSLPRAGEAPRPPQALVPPGGAGPPRLGAPACRSPRGLSVHTSSPGWCPTPTTPDASSTQMSLKRWQSLQPQCWGPSAGVFTPVSQIKGLPWRLG